MSSCHRTCHQKILNYTFSSNENLFILCCRALRDLLDAAIRKKNHKSYHTDDNPLPLSSSHKAEVDCHRFIKNMDGLQLTPPTRAIPMDLLEITPLLGQLDFNLTSTPLPEKNPNAQLTPSIRHGSNKSVSSTPFQRSTMNFSASTLLTRTTSTSILEGDIHNDSNWQPCILEPFYHLPTIDNPQTDSVAFRSISAETLSQLLDLPRNEFESKYILIDCRYPYEYDGGHIKYAINFHENDCIQNLFYPDNNDVFDEINKKIPIFYCEYSQVRGPKMAHALRRFDRRRNELQYPYVDYEEMYLLDCGYNKFYKLFKKQGYCAPDHYVPMNCKHFANHLKKFHFHRSRYQPNRKVKRTPPSSQHHYEPILLCFNADQSLEGF